MKKRKQPECGHWKVDIIENTVFAGLWQYQLTSENGNVIIYGGDYYPTWAQAVEEAYKSVAREIIVRNKDAHLEKEWSHMFKKHTSV